MVCWEHTQILYLVLSTCDLSHWKNSNNKITARKQKGKIFYNWQFYAPNQIKDHAAKHLLKD